MRQLAVKALWAVVISAAYVGLFHLSFWSLQKYPIAVLIILAMAGIPLVVVGVRIAGREEQRRYVWDSVRNSLRAELSLVPGSVQEHENWAAGRINDIPFRALKVDVNDSGIRLDRPLSPVKPIIVPWAAVQRLDTVDTSKVKMHKDPLLNIGALIRLRDGQTEILLLPWPDAYQRCVPEQVGQDRLIASR